MDDMLLEAGLGRNRKKYFSVAVGQERQRLTRQTDFQGSHSTAALSVLMPEAALLLCQMGSDDPVTGAGRQSFFKEQKTE